MYLLLKTVMGIKLLNIIETVLLLTKNQKKEKFGKLYDSYLLC